MVCLEGPGAGPPGTDLQVVRPISLSPNSEFAKLAVGDGTFGPRGTTFTWTWSNAQFGEPEIVAPSGARLDGWWGGQSGGTGWWQTYSGYGTAGAVAQGRLISANMLEGVFRITASQAGDMPYPEAATHPVVKGRAEYVEAGLHLVYGEHGFGHWELPLPWGRSANIDAYLVAQGHPRAG